MRVERRASESGALRPRKAHVLKDDKETVSWESRAIPIALLVAIAAYAILALGIHLLVKFPPPDYESIAKLFLPHIGGGLLLEPEERLLYLVGIVCAIVLPMAIFRAMAFRYSFPSLMSRYQDKHTVWAWLGCLSLIFLVWLARILWSSEILSMRLLLPLGLALALALSFCTRVRPAPRPAVMGVLIAGMLLFYSFLLVAGEGMNNIYFVRHHFDLLLGAANQVLHGRTVLVDTTSQYGIAYPYVLALYSWGVGISFTHLSLFFAALSFLTLFLLYLAIGQKSGYGSLGTLFLFAGLLGLFHPFNEQCLFSAPAQLMPYYQ